MISPKKITRAFIYIVTFLLLASIASSFLQYVSIDNLILEKVRYNFVYYFKVDYEGNIPTWFQSCMLLICSILLGIITFTKKINGDRYTLYWGILSFIFLCMSMDEVVRLHEKLIKLRVVFDWGGLLYFAWIVPAIAFLLVLAVIYFRFFMNLHRKTRLLFLISGILYVGGAVMVEAISGFYSEKFGEMNMAYELITTVEESLEMFGLVVFIYALLLYITSQIELDKLFASDHKGI